VVHATTRGRACRALRIGHESIRRRAHLPAPRQQLALFGGLLARTLEQAVELLSRHLLQRTEIGPRQRGPFEVAQQAGAIAPLLRFEDAALAFEVSLRLFERTPLLVQRAAPRDLVEGAAPMLVADLAGRLAIGGRGGARLARPPAGTRCCRCSAGRRPTAPASRTRRGARSWMSTWMRS
jgi:hypothetical protein